MWLTVEQNSRPNKAQTAGVPEKHPLRAIANEVDLSLAKYAKLCAVKEKDRVNILHVHLWHNRKRCWQNNGKGTNLYYTDLCDAQELVRPQKALWLEAARRMAESNPVSKESFFFTNDTRHHFSM